MLTGDRTVERDLEDRQYRTAVYLPRSHNFSRWNTAYDLGVMGGEPAFCLIDTVL